MACEGIPTGVHLLCEREGRVLLLRRAGTGFFDGLYSLPGGHVEAGESVRQAAVREAQEEVGIEVGVEELEWVGVVHRLSDTNRIDFFVRARKWGGEARICEPDKSDGLAWFARDALPAAIVPYVREVLQAGRGPWIRESGW